MLCGFGLCSRAILKKPVVKAGFGFGPGREHREIFVVVELVVDPGAEQAQIEPLLLDHDRHRRRDLGGRVGADGEIDLVHVKQLGVDAGHRRRIALIIVIDELDRAAEQAALGVDVLFPDLHRDERHLAVGRERAGERHAKADLDRLSGRSLGVRPKASTGASARRCGE